MQGYLFGSLPLAIFKILDTPLENRTSLSTHGSHFSVLTSHDSHSARARALEEDQSLTTLGKVQKGFAKTRILPPRAPHCAETRSGMSHTHDESGQKIMHVSHHKITQTPRFPRKPATHNANFLASSPPLSASPLPSRRGQQPLLRRSEPAASRHTYAPRHRGRAACTTQREPTPTSPAYLPLRSG